MSEEKEIKKSSKKTTIVEEVSKTDEVKKEVKSIKKEFAIGVTVVDKRGNEFEVVSFNDTVEMHDYLKIILKDKSGNLSVQLKGKLQLV